MNKKVLISGITGITLAFGFSLYGLINLNNGKSTIAHAEEKNKADAPQLEIDNSIDSKVRIQNLMLNSIDNYEKASGTFEYFSSSGKFNLLVNYQTDLSNNPKSYEKIQIITSEQSTSPDFVDSEESVYDGDTITMAKTKKKTKETKVEKVKVAKISKIESEELKNSTIKDRIINLDGEKAYIHRLDPSYMGIAKTSLLPEDFAMGFLEDTTKWDIIGSEKIAGVNTLIIKGELNNYSSTRYNGSGFKLNVDPYTGILLQMEVKDTTGATKESIKTTSIQINEILNENLFKPE